MSLRTFGAKYGHYLYLLDLLLCKSISLLAVDLTLIPEYEAMSYEWTQLFSTIAARVRENPAVSLRGLSRQLQVGQRTLQKVVSNNTGKTFRRLRDDAMIEKIQALLISSPLVSMKEISFSAGFGSPRSFARCVRRLTGCSPCELRHHLSENVRCGTRAHPISLNHSANPKRYRG